MMPAQIVLITLLIVIVFSIFTLINFIIFSKFFSRNKGSVGNVPKEEIEQRNRALTATFRLNKIILESLNFEEVVQKIADTIPHELYFGTGIVALIDHEKQIVRRVAASRTKEAIEAIAALPVPFNKIEISLNDHENLMIRAVVENKPFITQNAYDVFRPVLTQAQSIQIQDIMGTKSTLIYPMYGSKNRAIGVFIASTKKTIQELSDYEYTMIGNFVDSIGIAVEHALIYKQLSDTTKEIRKVNEEMYKKNVQLGEKNKTLSLLRKIDEIVLSSVTNMQEVAQQVANIAAFNEDFKAIAILLFNKEEDKLMRLAVSQTHIITKLELQYNRILFGSNIPVSNKTNPLALAVNEKRMQFSDTLAPLIAGNFSKEEADSIQNMIGIKASFVYPLIFRNDVIGVMVISAGVSSDKLPFYQKDLLERLVEVVGISLENSLLYQEIQEANEKLKQLDKLKDEFVSLASHELRTPMTIIKSYVWMLLQQTKTGNFTDKQKLYLERTYTTTDRLIKLVNDMLNVSRIESGRISLELKAIDIIQLVKDVEVEMLPKAQELGAKLIVESYEQLPLAMADSERIKQVLINLIGNALKFTSSGGTVKVILTRTGENITLKVQDTGKGISKEDLGRLFQKFGTLQTNSLTKTNPQGTGLGLYISKSLIEMHGGKISAESEGEGKGTTFLFTLKVAPPNATQPSPTPTTSINGAPTIIT